ncbi:hypothetical protein [Paenibacillus lactis]
MVVRLPGLRHHGSVFLNKQASSISAYRLAEEACLFACERPPRVGTPVGVASGAEGLPGLCNPAGSASKRPPQP